MATVPLSNVDTAWWRMEAPTNPMMITSVMTFDRPIDFDRLRVTVEHRLLQSDRFRQRIVQSHLPMVTPRWQDDPHLDLGYHLQQIDLPPPGDQAALQELVSHLMSTQLDFSRPLWQFHLVHNVGDGCAVVARLHHCIADGMALIQVLFSLTDREADAPWSEAKPRPEPGLARRLINPLIRPVRSAYQVTKQTTGTLWHEGLETLVHPSHAIDLARLAAGSAAALGRLALRWPDPKTLFKGPLGVPKRAAWSDPVVLQEVKEIGRALGGTVNDILLTSVSGALRGYLLEHGAAVDGLSIRGVIPVNLRPQGSARGLGNKFGLIFLSLPIGVADPLERLRQLKSCMDDIKRTPEAAVALGILNAIGMTASQIQDLVVTIFGTKGTAVMTNVPGPREKLYFAGAQISSVMAWVPQSGHLGLGVSIISYAGQVRLGIATDQGLVPDPERIVALFHDEFAALLARARAKPAARGVRPLLSALDEALATLDELYAPATDIPEQVTVPKAAPAVPKPEPAILDPAPARPKGRRRQNPRFASGPPAAPAEPITSAAGVLPVELKADSAMSQPEPVVPAGLLPDTAGEDFSRLWPASRPVLREADPVAPGVDSAVIGSGPVVPEVWSAAPLAGPEVPPLPARVQPAACQALTKAGVPCRNAALPGLPFCRVHQGRAVIPHVESDGGPSFRVTT